MRYYLRFLGAIPHQKVDSYALLTRPRLGRRIDPVPFACLRHAASVHPEPGSNSQKNFLPRSDCQGAKFASQISRRRPRTHALATQTRSIWKQVSVVGVKELMKSKTPPSGVITHKNLAKFSNSY